MSSCVRLVLYSRLKKALGRKSRLFLKKKSHGRVISRRMHMNQASTPSSSSKSNSTSFPTRHITGERGQYDVTIQTFTLPQTVGNTKSDVQLGESMIDAWKRDGIFQIEMTPYEALITGLSIKTSKQFFSLPIEEKQKYVSDLTYSGYIKSGEELTDEEADLSEIYTVTKDLSKTDSRVEAKWPCHGPAPWPLMPSQFQTIMTTHMKNLDNIGQKILKLISYGLKFDDNNILNNLTKDGWHHMRILRFPAVNDINDSRGIGAHTDYGLLVIAAQNDVGGLYIRPPVKNEHRNRNWLENESSAGDFEHDEPWIYVPPVPNVFTCFPGDFLQFITDGKLLSTPHKVRLNTKERYAMAYFHEPNFNACVKPLVPNSPNKNEHIHYGTHFTNMFMRCYPQRITTKRIHNENRLSILKQLATDSIAKSKSSK